MPQRVDSYLRSAITRGRLHHALLFLSGDKAEKESAAHAVAQSLLCSDRPSSLETLSCGRCANCLRVANKTHPNVIVVMPDAESVRRGKETESSSKSPSEEIRVEQMRRLTKEQHMHGFYDGAQIWIICDAHKMNTQASNALLKTLEEPQEKQWFILLAPTLNSVLPTIASRCQRLVFSIEKNSAALHFTESTGALFTKITQSNTRSRLEMADDMAKDKDSLLQTLQEMAAYLTETLRGAMPKNRRTRLTKLVLEIEKTRQSLTRHANTQLAIEELLLKSWPSASA